MSRWTVLLRLVGLLVCLLGFIVALFSYLHGRFARFGWLDGAFVDGLVDLLFLLGR